MNHHSPLRISYNLIEIIDERKDPAKLEAPEETEGKFKKPRGEKIKLEESNEGKTIGPIRLSCCES